MNKKTKKKRGNRNAFLISGAIISGIMLLVIIIGFFYTPYNPTSMDVTAKMAKPGLLHLLGTDNLGRDILSRIMKGMGTTFIIALGVVAIGCVAGIIIGSLCGYFGGAADAILTRVCDTITAFPSILLALVIVSISGGGTANVILALGILFIPSFARIVRSEFARARSANYIESARLMKAGSFRIIFVHILPNTMGVLLPAMTIGFNNAVLSEASMSFLGVGVRPPAATLGSMLRDAQTYLRNAPWYALSTGITIALLILGFSLLSEGLQQRNRKE